MSRSRRGRPVQTADSSENETRESILDAAEQLFARDGFDATTIKQIGAAASLNPALIYYYFGDKRGLHQVVIERFGRELFTRAGQALDAAETPQDVLRAIVTTQSAMFSGYPQRARILARELIDHDAAHAQELLETLARTVFARLRDAIAEGQRRGSFRRDVDPGYAAVSTIAQLVYFHLARPVVQTVLSDRGPIGRRQEEEFAAHAADFALAALAKPTRPRPRARTTGRR